MASYLLKTINLLMLRLLQYAPREATFCATLACLAEKARRPGRATGCQQFFALLWRTMRLQRRQRFFCLFSFNLLFTSSCCSRFSPSKRSSISAS